VRAELRYYRDLSRYLVDRLFGGRPQLAARVLPAVAIGLAAVLGLTAWALTPNRDVGPDRAVADGFNADQAAPTVPATTPAPTPTSTTPMLAAAGPSKPRVARARTTGLFPSGLAAGSLTEANAWANYRGRPNDVVVTYSERTSWRTITNPWMGSTTGHFAGFAGTWVISQPLFPESGPEKGNLRDCAAGAYNAHWRQFGTWLNRMGRSDSFVRLGWEFNGLWFAWAASDPDNWIQCFRNASSAIRATDPAVRIDWNFNAHGSQTPVGVFGLYPGDNYVDVIGVDSYDHYPPSHDSAEFDEQCHGTEGLCVAIAFARQHNKLFSVPEWGVVGKTGTKAGLVNQAGGDNPLYIQKMHDLFVANADILAYEAYFSDDTPGNVRSSLFNPVDHPMSSALYKSLW
jgi:hypothetical protein